MVRLKRQRGAQPKNTNALKHGIYAGALGERARKVLRIAEKMDAKEIAKEIALMRTVIDSLLEIEPANIQALVLAAGVLCRMVALEHRLDAKQERGLNDSLVRLIRDIASDEMEVQGVVP